MNCAGTDARMRTLIPEYVNITGSAIDDQEGSEAIPGSIDVEDQRLSDGIHDGRPQHVVHVVPEEGSGGRHLQ